MRIDEIENGGDCYQRAWQQITSMNQKEAENVRLVHGEVIGQGKLLGRHYGHAWLETTIEIRKGITLVMINDCSNSRNVELPRDVYYRFGGIVDEPGKLFRYTVDEARKYGVRTGHYGSWELDIEKDELSEVEDIATARGRRNKKALGYDAAVAQQQPLRTLEPGKDPWKRRGDGLKMRNVHDILKDLARRAMGNSGDTIKAKSGDAYLIKIILELLDLSTKRSTRPYLLSPDDEHRAELYNVIIPRMEEIEKEIEAADGT